LSYFNGTSREPILEAVIIPESNEAALQAFYPLMSQWGLDLQLTSGGYLWKLEAIHRTATQRCLCCCGCWFGITFVGLFGSDWDVGTLVEYNWDSDANQSTRVFNNDLFVGLRLAANDVADTAILIGVNHDLDSSAQIVRAEIERRMFSDFTIAIEFQSVQNTEPFDTLHAFRKDSYFQIGIARYF
jgi:hypothetical protein